MTLTAKYEFEALTYGTQGWNGIMQTNFEKIDDHLHTRGQGTCGEDIDTYEAVYWKSDGKIWLAQANGTAQPCIGLAIEDGVSTDEIRFQTYGLITNSSWTWTVGVPIYLDPTTPGALTETPSGSDDQVLGYSQSATTIFLTPLYIGSLIDQSYEISGLLNGALTNSIVLERRPMARAITFEADLSESYMYCEPTSGATASAAFSITKNAVEFATATFSAGQTIDNAAAVDKTGGKVGIPVTGHGLAIGRIIVIAGSTNYNAQYTIDADTTTNEIVIVETYTAETFAGTETITLPFAVIACASETVFAAGDVFKILGPASADATLQELGWNIVGIR